MKGIAIAFMLAVSILGSVLGSVYMYTNYLNTRMETVQKENLDRIVQLRTCLNMQDSTYRTDWDAACSGIDKGNNCSLPADQTILVESRLERNQNVCVQLYNHNNVVNY